MDKDRMNIELREISNNSLASTSDRILAAILDTLIIDLMFLFAFAVPIILRIVWIYNNQPTLLTLITVFWSTLVPLACVGMLLYLILLPAFKGRTLGQKVLKIKPMIIENLETMSLKPFSLNDVSIVFKRVLFGIVDALPFGLVGIYLMNKHPLNQAFCDRMTNVVVVRAADEKKMINQHQNEITQDKSSEEMKNVTPDTKKPPKSKKK